MLTECRWYKEGVTAKAEGKTLADCPYGGGSPKAILWAEGFNSVDDGGASVVCAKIEEATALLKAGGFNDEEPAAS